MPTSTASWICRCSLARSVTSVTTCALPSGPVTSTFRTSPCSHRLKRNVPSFSVVTSFSRKGFGSLGASSIGDPSGSTVPLRTSILSPALRLTRIVVYKAWAFSQSFVDNITKAYQLFRLLSRRWHISCHTKIPGKISSYIALDRYFDLVYYSRRQIFVLVRLIFRTNARGFYKSLIHATALYSQKFVHNFV